VLSLALASLVFAALLARAVLRRPSAGTEARRLVSAATRAAEAFLFREGKMAGAGTAMVLALVLALYGLSVARHMPVVALGTVLWTGVAALFGAAVTFSVAYVATAVGLRAALRAVSAAQFSLDQAASLSLRAAGIAAITADALTAAAVSGFFGLLYLLGGGGAIGGPDRALALVEHAAAVLPGLGVGSIAAALVVGLGGVAYHVSTAIGSLAVSGLEPTDLRHPSLVATLVGEHVGLGARRAVDMVAATILGNIATVALGVAAFRIAGAATSTRAWALITLPLVLRGIGVIASLLGLLSARSTESGRAASALWRGQLTTSVLVLAGLAGAALWLVGSPACGWFIAAGASGVITSALAGHVARHRVDRRLTPVQDLIEATRSGSAVTLGRGLAYGLRGVWVPVVLLALCLGGSLELGKHSELVGADLLAMATALAGFLSMSGYMLALGLFGPIASGAMTIAGLDGDTLRPEVRRRAAQLDDAGFESGAVSESFFAVLGGASALMAGVSILLGPSSSEHATLSLRSPAVLWSGVLGAAFVFAFSGNVLESVARATRGAAAEVERQLRGFPREGGVAVVPPGYTPSYRALIDLASRSSVEGVLLPTFAGVLAPALLGIGLRVLYTSDGLAREGLAAFVVIASATGLGAALATDGSRTVLGAAYRASRPRGTSTGLEASLAGHALGSFLGDVAAPATHLFVKATAAAALLVAPFLSAP
jgi:K(+)-stimulated pyrophosphate-energized sodium pump